MRMKRTLSVRKAARWLDVDPGDIRQAIERGQLDAVRVGDRVRITRSAWRAFLGERNNDSRRRHSRLTVALIAGLILTGTALAVDPPAFIWDYQPVPPQDMEFTAPNATTESDPARYAKTYAPLDYRRYNDTADAGTPGTGSVMALQLQNNVPEGTASFPWTTYLQLDSNHDAGDGVVSHLRLWNRGAGWAAAAHTDAFALGSGTTLGQNIEVIDMTGEAYTVGLNIQNKAFRSDVGIQVQTGPYPEGHRFYQEGMDGSWYTGLRLAGDPEGGEYHTGIELGPNTRGRRGLWMRGDYDTGIDMGENDISMSGGARVDLDGNQGVGMRYNPARDRIEFLRGSEIIAFLDVDERGVDLAR